jgi:hypothetical protein
MKQRIFAGLLLGSLLVWNAMGQNPPATPVAKPKEPPSPSLSVEEILQRAAMNDPEVKIAEAEMQLAKAKLDAVRMNAVKKIAEIHNKVEEAIFALNSTKERIQNGREQLSILKDKAAKLEKREAVGEVSAAEVSTARVAVLSMQERYGAIDKEHASATLNANRLQNEWKRIYDAAKMLDNRVELDAESAKRNQKLVVTQKAASHEQPKAQMQILTASASEKLKIGLKKKIKLEAHGADLESFTKILFEKADLNVIIRYDLLGEKFMEVAGIQLTVPAAELTLFGWLEYIADKFCVSGPERTHDFYIREYGIALMAKENAPATAIKLQDFWRQIQEEKPSTASPEK